MLIKIYSENNSIFPVLSLPPAIEIDCGIENGSPQASERQNRKLSECFGD
jgi:hypothetical protein